MKKINFISLISVSLLTLLLIPSVSGDQQEKSEKNSISLKEVSPFIYCCLHHKGPFTDIENVINQLMSTSQSQNVFPAGPLIGIYYNSPQQVKPEDLEWEIGFPVTPQATPQAPLEKKQWSFTQVASAIHAGPFEKTGETISRIHEWMKDHHLVPSGPVLERYLTMPTPESKPEDMKAEIWIPCQKQE